MAKNENPHHNDRDPNGSIDSDRTKCLVRASSGGDGMLPVTPKQRRGESSLLARQVSHECLAGLEEAASMLDDVRQEVFDRSSPIQASSEPRGGLRTITLPDPSFATSHNLAECRSPRNGFPPMPNPLYNEHFFPLHRKAIRLEAALHPLKHILYRLMSHTSLNRKGLFNFPVDPISMQAPDYFEIVKKPMDLGTIKKKLHSMIYSSLEDVIDDIRLCFSNAMLYNPPTNAVHVNARGLLQFFEEQLQSSCFTEDRLSESSTVPLPLLQRQRPLPATWSDTQPLNPPALPPHNSRKRKLRSTKHSCHWCFGQSCFICGQGCKQLEHALLLCSGNYCLGAKIRKHEFYHISPDGDTIFCEKCFAVLPSALTEIETHRKSSCRYKADLLKRKNDEDVFESWITCVTCHKSAHHVCAFFNPYTHNASEYECPSCSKIGVTDELATTNTGCSGTVYTYVAGEEQPVPLSAAVPTFVTVFNARALPRSPIADFMESKVRSLLSAQCINSDKTVYVRLISDTEKSFLVPNIIQRFFETNERVHSPNGDPVRTVGYKSKAIALFQTIDGLDVCIFCMYVQEYSSPEKRVYVAYLDSVEYFRPSSLRTVVYQEMITAYLATAKKRGFTNAHIWACPPLRGNSFIFWNHPAGQRTPTMERLTSWYNCVLSRAIEVGVVSGVVSLYESDFEQPMAEIGETLHGEVSRHSKMPCPPLLEGDFWIEEALRLYQATAYKYTKESMSSSSTSTASVDLSSDICPAMSLAAMLRDRIIPHPSSLAFRRPVNAAALKIRSYHDVIHEPMDLSTIFAKVSLGEYETLSDFVADMELVVANAMRFNHCSNPVHLQAVALQEIFFRELNNTTRTWCDACTDSAAGHSWRTFRETSLSLSHGLNRELLPTPNTKDSLFSNYSPLGHIDCKSSDSIHRRMVGKDVDLFKRKITYSAKKQKRYEVCPLPFQDSKAEQRRRQTWLGEQVGRSVRRLRTSLFNCFLHERGEPFESFIEYCEVSSFECIQTNRRSRIADSRHGFHEFSQLRNLEFDTLRKAKYSTAIMLYHLHCDEAPGVDAVCSWCSQDIDKVRWHFIGKLPCVLTAPKAGEHERYKAGQDICGACFANCANKSLYIPIPVSI